jgi:Intracellular proteinase inhibitor
MKSRTVAALSAACLVVAVVIAATGCGTSSGAGGSPTTAPGVNVVLTVEQALAAEEGQMINVKGALFATGERTVLASAMAESYPPQPGGAQLPVEGLDLASLVGLSSTADQPGMAAVTWTDYWVVLKGVVKDGVLQVQGTPRVVEVSDGDLKIRFSPVSEPISSGDQIWWAFDVTNTGQTAVDLTFSSGQKGEVILNQGAAEKYRWSEGKAFTEAIETVTLAPGKSLSVVLNDTLSVPPGDYNLFASVTASAGGTGSANPLQGVQTTLQVH